MAQNQLLFLMLQFKKLLYIGRLDKDVGFDICVELCLLLKDKYKIKFEIIGDGELKPLIPKTAKFFGSVTNPDIYVSRNDVIYTTGFLTFLEAAIAKKLIIASYADPVRRDYVLMHPISKYMVTGSKASEIKAKLESLSLNDVNLMTKNAYNWAKLQTWEKLAKQHEEIWFGGKHR